MTKPSPKKAIVRKGEFLLVLRDGGSMMYDGVEMIARVAGRSRDGLFRCVLVDDPLFNMYLHVGGEGQEWKRMGDRETLICQRCKAPKTIAKAVTVGDKMRLSGYETVMRADTTIIWLCPACVEFLRPHIQLIVEATEGASLYWPNMVSFLKPKPEKKEDS